MKHEAIKFRDLSFYEKSAVAISWVILIAGSLYFVLAVMEVIFS